MTAQSQTHEKLWTPANVVTLLRICGVPLFVVVIMSPWPSWIPEWYDAEIWKPWIAAGIFTLLAATDALDGYLARSRGEVTNFGKFIDPLADKILVAAALLALIELGKLPSWVALIILCREFIVSGIRMVSASRGIVIAASWYGKAKTVFQIIAIVLFIIKDSHMVSSFSAVLSDRLYLFSWAMMIIALIFTIISMMDYFVKAKEVLGFRPSSTKDSNGFPLTLDNTVQKADNSDVTTNRVTINQKTMTESSESGYVSLFNDEVIALVREILVSAQSQGKTVGTAESCTGGLIAAALTDVPGSSDAVEGGIVSYSNAVKQTCLDVDAQTLNNFGAVSEQTACEMAEGARKALSVDLAISVTGIAGPDGGSDEKPVGTVWIGCSSVKTTQARRYYFEGDREAIRSQTVSAALSQLKDALARG